MGKWQARVGEMVNAGMEHYKHQALSCCTHLEFKLSVDRIYTPMNSYSWIFELFNKFIWGKYSIYHHTLPGNLDDSLWTILVYWQAKTTCSFISTHSMNCSVHGLCSE